MPTITSENAAAWQDLANALDATAPRVGRMAYVVAGKAKGRYGNVVRHVVNRFASTRYVTEAQGHFRDMAGRYGFRVCIRPFDGTPDFWADADKVEVLTIHDGWRFELAGAGAVADLTGPRTLIAESLANRGGGA